jgi:acetylornithine deacetylase/succinyl-diaminopimelate desuccinylase-like protein
MVIGACQSGIGETFYSERPATVSDRGVVRLDVRYDHNQNEEMIYEDIETLITKLQSMDPSLDAKVAPMPEYITRPSYNLPMDSQIVQHVGSAHRAEFGADIVRRAWGGGHDGAFMQAAGIETACYGLGGASQHDPGTRVDTHDLYITETELLGLSRVLARATTTICNASPRSDSV